MSARAIAATRRTLRKLLGAEATKTVVDVAYDFRMFQRRGFFGRFKWLLFGR